jgi:hypothetical protein
MQIGKAVPVEIVLFLAFCALMAGLYWFAYRMDPHYSSKDGTRFLCNAQDLVDAEPFGRKRETRVTVDHDGVLLVSQKKFAKRSKERWALVGKSPEPPRGKTVYVIRQFDDGKWLPEMMTLSLPSKSRSIAVLDDAMARRGVTP